MARIRPENRLSARFAIFSIPVYNRNLKMVSVLSEVLSKTEGAFKRQLNNSDFNEDFSRELDPRTGKLMRIDVAMNIFKKNITTKTLTTVQDLKRKTTFLAATTSTLD